LIRLENGRDVAFSPEVCEFSVHVDETVWVDVDATGTRAVRVTISDPSVARPPIVPLAARLERVRSLGLATELHDTTAAALRDDLGVEDNTYLGLETILNAFYADHPDAAARDAYLRFDWKYPLGDLIVDVNAMVGGAPLLHVVNVRDDRPRSSDAVVTVRGRDGSLVERQMSFVVEILEVANEFLAKGGDKRRFYMLQGGGDDECSMLLLPERASALGKILRLTPPGP